MTNTTTGSNSNSSSGDGVTTGAMPSAPVVTPLSAKRSLPVRGLRRYLMAQPASDNEWPKAISLRKISAYCNRRFVAKHENSYSKKLSQNREQLQNFVVTRPTRTIRTIFSTFLKSEYISRRRIQDQLAMCVSEPKNRQSIIYRRLLPTHIEPIFTEPFRCPVRYGLSRLTASAFRRALYRGVTLN
jgi:hypothetical protein